MSDAGNNASSRTIERQQVAATTLAEIIEAQFTESLGRSAADYMPRVRMRARDGEPNWEVEIGIAGLPILSAFLDAVEKVKAVYDLDPDSHARLLQVV